MAERPARPRVISYAAQLPEAGTAYQPNGHVFLHFVSDHDVYNDLGATVAWDHENLAPPSWTVGLWNADHSGPYADPSDPTSTSSSRATVDFLDQELKGASNLWLYLTS